MGARAVCFIGRAAGLKCGSKSRGLSEANFQRHCGPAVGLLRGGCAQPACRELTRGRPRWAAGAAPGWRSRGSPALQAQTRAEQAGHVNSPRPTTRETAVSAGRQQTHLLPRALLPCSHKNPGHPGLLSIRRTPRAHACPRAPPADAPLTRVHGGLRERQQVLLGLGVQPGGLGAGGQVVGQVVGLGGWGPGEGREPEQSGRQGRVGSDTCAPCPRQRLLTLSGADLYHVYCTLVCACQSELAAHLLVLL